MRPIVIVVHLDARFCGREEDSKLGELTHFLWKLKREIVALRLTRKHAVECGVVIVMEYPYRTRENLYPHPGKGFGGLGCAFLENPPSKTNQKTSQPQSRCQLTLPRSIARLGWVVNLGGVVVLTCRWLVSLVIVVMSSLLWRMRERRRKALKILLHAREVEGGTS